jgi:Domain of unknown function (DUF4203)
MLPIDYQLPAAVVLVAGGLLSCLLGYRLFKVVLAIFGFIIGGLAASSVFGESAATAMVIAAIVGGLCGAILMFAAYFLGVALVGAGVGVATVHVIWTQVQGDPHPAVVIVFAVLGALLATWLQRYVIILGTAFGGAWTVVVGAAALLGNPSALKAAAAGDVWVAYPMNPAPGQSWVPWAFIALGAAGTLVQMYLTAGDRGRIGKKKAKVTKEE